MAKIVAFFGWDDLPKFFFDFGWFFYVVDKTDEVGQPDAMCVCDDSGLTENISHYEVRALSADTGKCQEFLHVIGNIAAVLFVNDFHACRNISCFGITESARADYLFNLLHRSLGKSLDRRIFFI